MKLRRINEEAVARLMEDYDTTWQEEVALLLLGSTHSSSHTDAKLVEARARSRAARDKWLGCPWFWSSSCPVIVSARARAQAEEGRRERSRESFAAWRGDRETEGSWVAYWDGRAWVLGQAGPGLCPLGYRAEDS